MTELDAQQLRLIAEVLDHFDQIETNTGIAVDGRSGRFQIAVPAYEPSGTVRAEMALVQVVEVARTTAPDGTYRCYVAQMGD